MNDKQLDSITDEILDCFTCDEEMMSEEGVLRRRIREVLGKSVIIKKSDTKTQSCDYIIANLGNTKPRWYWLIEMRLLSFGFDCHAKISDVGMLIGLRGVHITFGEFEINVDEYGICIIYRKTPDSHFGGCYSILQIETQNEFDSFMLSRLGHYF